jgi:hypothetical protein
LSRRSANLGKGYSSDLFTFTRVSSRKKEARKTVGLTINPRLLEEARKRNLNLSRIFEQALSSILDYIPKETETESSISFLSRGSFPKESRAGSSVWYERRIRNAEVVGSNPARSTEHFFRKKFRQKKRACFPVLNWRARFG